MTPNPHYMLLRKVILSPFPTLHLQARPLPPIGRPRPWKVIQFPCQRMPGEERQAGPERVAIGHALQADRLPRHHPGAGSPDRSLSAGASASAACTIAASAFSLRQQAGNGRVVVAEPVFGVRGGRLLSH